MRVLVVDQDSTSNETIVRSLREHYVVDAVTNKGDSLDLLRSNTFEVIVAGERLEDGSGLELLGQVSKKYPSILRIFAADRHRLKLLKGRLGPFELFQTLAYPIDPERLLATLMLADAAQDAHADTSNIQHVVLSGSLESEEAPDPFPAPQPEARAAPDPAAQDAPEPAAGKRPAVARDSAPQRARAGPGQRSRRTGAAGPSATRAALGAAPARAGAPPTPRSPSVNSPHRHGRMRSGTNKAPPVRFPPLETPEATSPAAVSFAETVALARAARDNLDHSPNELDYKRIAVLVGTGAAIVLGVIVLGFRLFGSKSDAPRQTAATTVHAPEYPTEVTDLIVQTESALSADDYKGARADVDKLHQLAPSHPRLAFFDSLLAQKSAGSKSATADTGHTGAGTRGSTKRGSQAPRKSGGGSDGEKAPATTGGEGPVMTSGSADGARAPASGGAMGSAGSPSPDASLAAQAVPGFAPETPAGLSRPSTAAAAISPADSTAQQTNGSGSSSATASGGGLTSAGAPGSGGASAAASGLASAGGSVSTGTPGSAAAASLPTSGAAKGSASTHPSASSPTRRANSDEPPPVVREAKLIRRVSPDYPSAAKKEGIVGFVELQITVSQQGVVKDATVVNSDPRDVFDKAALAAVRKWKYDPRFVDGLPSEAELKVHLDFTPGQ